jgi:hypothetical protein
VCLNPDSLIHKLGKRGAAYVMQHPELTNRVLPGERAELMKLGESSPTAWETLSNPEEAKQPVIERSTRALNMISFPNEEETFAEIEQKLAGLKRKYASVHSVAELLKDPPNPLHDKTLGERLIWGANLAYTSAEYFSVDIAPFIAYRLNHRFNTGLSLMYRINVISQKPYRIHALANDRVTFRVFGEYQSANGLLAVMEYEQARQEMAPVSTDGRYRQVYHGFNVGAGKVFRIRKSWHGQFLVLYDVAQLFQENRVGSPLGMRLGVRRQAY